MRLFLLLLAVAFPVVLASPMFWGMVAMEYSAEPVGYGRPDGSIQPALLGPKAPWPEWVLRPDDVTLTVKAWYGETPVEPSMGYGYLAYSGQGKDRIAAYARLLEAAGWQVETSLSRATTADLPPRPTETCFVRAARADGDRRIIQARFELTAGAGRGALHWATGPMPGWDRPKGEPC